MSTAASPVRNTRDRSVPTWVIALLAMVASLLPVIGGAASAQPVDPVGGDVANVSAEEAALIERAADAGSIRVLVWTDDGAERRRVLDALATAGGEVLITYHAFPVVLAEVDADAVATLAADPAVRGMSEDVLLPPTLASSLPVINADDLQTGGIDGTGTAVAILDTGIDVDHPFFAGRIVSQACFSNAGGTAGGISLCPNGGSSQIGGNAADAETAACLSGLTNICTHGSHVAGISAGDATGSTPGAPGDGVAPSADIVAIQVFTRFNSFLTCSPNPAPCVLAFNSDLLLALQRVNSLQTVGALSPQQIVAANMSLGGGQFFSACDTEPLKAAIDALQGLGVATVIAAGNEGFLNSVGFPGCISTAVTVGATTDADLVASFSNRGPLLDVFAPGVSIDSAIPDDTYDNFQGTSMAAPHVAGALALVRDAYPCETAAQAEARLTSTGVPVTYSNGIQLVTTRRIDLLAAVTPDNDDFADAEVLSGGTASACGTNLGTSSEPGEPAHAGVGGISSVWYQWTAPSAGFVTIDTHGSSYDTALAAYTGSSVGGLTEVASNDDTGGLTSEIAFTPTPNTTYRIAVDGFIGSTGAIELNLVQVDVLAPAVDLVVPADNVSFPRGASVPASYSCTDEPGGSGIASCVGDVASGSDIDTATLGAKTFTVTGTDNVGNSTTVVHNYTVVDDTDPVVTITDPAQNADIPRGSTVLAGYTCTDEAGGSGIASCVGDVASGSAIDTATLGAKTFTVTGTDNAGNTTTVVRNYTVVDTTDPVVTVTTPAAGDSYPQLSEVLASYSCTDEAGGSGIASCVGDVASGSAIDTATTGGKTFTVTGTDNAGNTTTVQRSYSVFAVLPAASEEHTVGLVDPAQGQWHLRDRDGAVTTFFFGNPGDVPVMGDWDCDGVDTPGLFRTSDAFAYLSNENRSKVADIRFFFGDAADVPLAGDWDGDGCDTLSIYRPSEQRFYVINELGENDGGLGAADFSFGFGDAGDKPVVGDWDADGTDEVGLHRESTGFFYWRNTLDTGIAHGQIFFGDPNDRFVAGDWGIVDGADTPAVFRPGDTTFYFRHTLTQGNADDSFGFGGAPWLPVAGNFGL